MTLSYLITESLWNELGVVMILGRVELADVEIDGAVRLVRKPFLDDLLDERDVLGNVLTHTGQAIGGQNLREKRKGCL